MNEVLTTAALGIGLGSMYALMAQGLVLIYRGSGVLNFAQAAVGVSGTYVWYELHAFQHWAFGPALLVALVVTALFGVLIHVCIMRPLRHASPLARTVATLGLLLTLESLIVIRYGTLDTLTTSELPVSLTHIFGVKVAADDIWLLGIAVAISLSLWVAYRFTPFGRATSAVAENQYGAATLGLSPDVIASINWALGSVLAVVAGVLIAPILGLQVTIMTTLLLGSLAGALVGRFRSFSIVLFACLGLGIAQNEVTRWVTNPDLAGLAGTLPFAMIIVVMVVRGQAIPLRDFLLERLPAVGSGRIRPLAAVIAVAVTVTVIAVVPVGWQTAIGGTFAFATFMLTFVILLGYTGQISLAQWGLAGLGAYVAGRLISSQGFSFPEGLLAGIAVTVLAGLALALPALRTRGINLAIITLGAAAALEQMLFDNQFLTGGYQGTSVTLSAFGFNFGEATHPARYGFVMLGCFVVIGLMVANVRRGLIGRRMLAVRNNERAATALGVDVRGVKLHSFGLAAAIAALGGILVSFGVGSVDYTQFAGLASIQYAGFAFLGGIGFILGPLQGASLLPGTVGTQFGTTVVPGLGTYLGLIGGVSLILIVLANQDGVAPQIIKQMRWVSAHVPLRRLSLTPRTTRAIAAEVIDTSANGSRGAAHHQPRVAPKELEVRGLTVRYGNVVAVNDLSLNVKPGSITGLIGPNGAGKTSLLDAVTGFTPLAAGSVLLAGEDIGRMSAVRRAREGIGRSFQSLELFEDMTVVENIFAASDSRDWRYNLTELIRPKRSTFGPDLAAIVREFQLEDDLEKPATDLPYGRRRLLAIARAVAARPSVLLLDEPAAGLSGRELRELAIVVKRLATDWGMAVLLIEHDVEFVLETCDELEVIDFGRKISSGSPDVVRNDPAVITAYLGTGSAKQAVAEPG